MLIRNTLLYLPAQIIGPAVQFAAILAFTNWMAPEAYGIFTYVLAGQDFVFLLSLYWWSQYTVRYLSAHEMNADTNYRRSELSIVAATIVLQIVASILILRLVADRVTLDLGIATVGYIVTRCLNLHLGERARARNRIFDYTLAQSIGPIIGFVLAFAAIVLVSPTPEVALSGYALAQLVTLIILMLRQEIDYVWQLPDGNLLRRALWFGLPLIAAAVAVWCGMNAIRILVNRDLGTAAMGLIAVGWGLGNRLTSTAAMLVTVAAYPLAVETLRGGSKERAYEQITMNGVLMLGILLPASVGLYLVQGPFVSLFVAEPFRSMTLAVLPAALAAGVFRNLRTHVIDQIYMLIEKTSVVCAMSVAEAVLAISGCFLGLILGGAAGAAVGTATGYGLALVGSFIVAMRGAGVPMPWLAILRVVASVAVMAAILVLLRGIFHDDAPAMIVQIVVGFLVYAAMLASLFPDIRRLASARIRRVAPG